jgi:hypothetical protein
MRQTQRAVRYPKVGIPVQRAVRYPRSECPIYAAFKDGMVRNVVDDVFWRKDGTSFPVE